MSLDAFVFCRCFEDGIATAPPVGLNVRVAEDGSLECLGSQTENLRLFDEWQTRACAHPQGILLHHRLGNIGLIGFLRGVFKRFPSKFPVISSKILYDGIHSGDYLTVEDAMLIESELAELARLEMPDRRESDFVEVFRQQLVDLVEAALLVRKPIAF